MKKRLMFKTTLALLICLSVLSVNVFAESGLAYPKDLWPETEQNINPVTITQEADGVKFAIRNPAVGENTDIDWAGNMGYVDFSEPVEIVMTVNSLDFGTATYALDWSHNWTAIIGFSGGQALTLNLGGSTTEEAGQMGNMVWIGPGYQNDPFHAISDRTFAGTTYFWKIDIKNQEVLLGTSSSPDVQPTNMTNLLRQNFDKLPDSEDPDDYMANFYLRPFLGGSSPDLGKELVFTIHEFAGNNMLAATVKAKEGQGATVSENEITYDVAGKTLTVANLLMALDIEGGTYKVFDGAIELGSNDNLVDGIEIEVTNGLIVNTYVVDLLNLPVQEVPTTSDPDESESQPSDTNQDESQTEDESQPGDTNTHYLFLLAVLVSLFSIVILIKKNKRNFVK